MHRYPDRVLLEARACLPGLLPVLLSPRDGRAGTAAALSRDALEAALDYIRAHPDIWEVILTGGDPLILSPRRLRAVVRALGAIEHVKVIRVHTPSSGGRRRSAITPTLVRALKVDGKAPTSCCTPIIRAS